MVAFLSLQVPTSYTGLKRLGFRDIFTMIIWKPQENSIGNYSGFFARLRAARLRLVSCYATQKIVKPMRRMGSRGSEDAKEPAVLKPYVLTQERKERTAMTTRRARAVNP